MTTTVLRRTSRSPARRPGGTGCSADRSVSRRRTVRCGRRSTGPRPLDGVGPGAARRAGPAAPPLDHPLLHRGELAASSGRGGRSRRLPGGGLRSWLRRARRPPECARSAYRSGHIGLGDRSPARRGPAAPARAAGSTRRPAPSCGSGAAAGPRRRQRYATWPAGRSSDCTGRPQKPQTARPVSSAAAAWCAAPGPVAGIGDVGRFGQSSRGPRHDTSLAAAGCRGAGRGVTPVTNRRPPTPVTRGARGDITWRRGMSGGAGVGEGVGGRGRRCLRRGTRRILDLLPVVRRVVAARMRDPHLVDDLVAGDADPDDGVRGPGSSRRRWCRTRSSPRATSSPPTCSASIGSGARRTCVADVDADADAGGRGAASRSAGRLVDEALDRLPARERELLVAHEVEGTDTATLAAGRDSTPGAIAAQLNRSRAKLRVEVLLAQAGASRRPTGAGRC